MNNLSLLSPATDVAGMADLAAKINAAHREARDHATRAMDRALEAGDLLLKVKASLAHGQWLPWLEEHCPDISARTAQGYMRLARDLPVQIRTDAHLSLNGAKRLLSAPKDDAPDLDIQNNQSPEARPDQETALLQWLEKSPLFDGMHTQAVYLLDAAGWTIERITDALADNAKRLGFDHHPQAEEVSAWLNPQPPSRNTCCNRIHPDKAAANPKGADAEDLYRLALRYQLASFQRHHTEMALWLAQRLGRDDLAANLQGALRVIDRGIVKPPTPGTLLEQAARTAALVDAFHGCTDTLPDDGWKLPIGMWAALCLRIAAEEDGLLWKAARAAFAVPVTPESVEAMPLFRAASVLLSVNGDILGNMAEPWREAA